MRCDAKMRPFPNPTELVCDLDAGHAKRHESVLRDYAYPGSATTISWDEGDRRTFRGEWTPCTWPTGCILPGTHTGNHAA